MELNKRAELDESQVNDLGRGGGGGGGFQIPTGGGRGGLVGILIAVVIALAGGGIGLSTMGGDESGSPSAGNLGETCAVANTERFNDVKCRNLLYVNSIQAYWTQAFPQLAKREYQPTDTNYFDGAVNTGCGQADSGVGPFYCPQDRQVYIDLSFYQVLSSRFGAEGEFAAPYVLAHEYGHHVQNLLGTSRRASEGDQSGPKSGSVRLELQADCYAGAWAKHATESRDESGQVALFESVTQTDIDQAIDTAEAIGDDTLQQQAGGRVNPDQFTHGTAEQRKRWFSTGYQAGDPTRCDTFGTDQL